MRTRVLFSVVAALFAATALGSASGAGTTRQAKVAQIDVSTRAAVVHYLQAIHVDTKGLVIQRGLRNYAGAHCPGAGWSCTSTAHPVVQVAGAGGANTFSCSTSKCAVVQVARAAAADNTAKCIKIVGLTQSCSINQTNASANNVAIVYEAAVGALTSSQTASVGASITQTASGPSNKNTACVSQTVAIDGSRVATGPVSIALEAHQTLTIKQDSMNGGNSAQSSATLVGSCDTGHPLTQRQVLNSIVAGRGAITQNENAANSGANMTIDIEQNQSSGYLGSAHGPNSANFNQTNSLNAVASTPNGPVSQTQSSVNGGLLGTINQDSRDLSTATATQTETQCEDAHSTVSIRCDHATSDPPSYTLTQTQYGPSHCCSVQGTATGDTFTINQTTTQDNDSGQNQTNNMGAVCTTSGTNGCTATQNTNIDGTPSTNTQTGQSVNTQTNCTGSTCTTPTITFDGSPGTNAPPLTLGPYTMTRFGSDTQPVCPAEGSAVTGVSDPAGSISFDQPLSHDTIGNCWATWSNDYTGDVYDSSSVNDPTGTNPQQITITLPSGTNAFYFYAEPDQFASLTVQATAQDGTTSGPISVQGEGGAQYFGFYQTGGATLSSITVTTSDTTGFAVGEFGINKSP